MIIDQLSELRFQPPLYHIRFYLITYQCLAGYANFQYTSYHNILIKWKRQKQSFLLLKIVWHLLYSSHLIFFVFLKYTQSIPAFQIFHNALKYILLFLRKVCLKKTMGFPAFVARKFSESLLCRYERSHLRSIFHFSFVHHRYIPFLFSIIQLPVSFRTFHEMAADFLPMNQTRIPYGLLALPNQ